MKKLKVTALAAALLTTVSGMAMAEEKLDIVFAVHSSASNTFWQAAKKGYDDACAKVSANCQMLFTQTEGSVPEQLANIEAALAQKPAAILTSIVDNAALDDVLQRARDAGIVVIGVNVDDLEGADGNARQAFIGQGFLAAGYSLGKAQSANFPAEGPIKVLMGISAPGQNWSEQRGQGVINFLEDYKKSSGRDISWEKIDSGTDLAITSDRVGAYLAAHPDTTAYFDTGFWHAGVARVLADRGDAPGKVLLGGFDLVPEAVEQMQKGYIQVEVDQQPYMQGFMPVMMVYLNKNFGLAPANVDTGQGIVKAADAAAIMELAAKGLR
ncbi:sugar ABC transporter substrate-binding protein [Kaistia granuli]|uniref:sugar ABC transporter substrate-binding protein n=1 Tax=Kaistia granuli TaxID=363259 RepID=UPI00036CE7AA|nr:sugar ABC transporter substrate-binding protein [Kaistia granuli]